MDNKIITYSTLQSLVNLDTKEHELKQLATFFLDAMNDWKLTVTSNIVNFLTDLKKYFGTPLTIDRIAKMKSTLDNLREMEVGTSITQLIDLSNKFYGETNFDKIIDNVLTYYEQDFSKVDFIAELKFLTAEQGGRQTPAHSGYRPQVKFDSIEMQTSGQQTFIDKEVVYPGDTVNAKIKIVSPDFFKGCLFEGMKFEFREGPGIIGTGEIKEIVNDKLEVASR